MNWSFGIITSGDSPHIKEVIHSIHRNGPPSENCEIIVIGGRQKQSGVDIWIPFDETIKDGWITKKKNLVAEIAHHDSLCLMHDYVALEPGWWNGVHESNDNWLTCMHKIVNKDGTRFRDWCEIYNDAWMDPKIDEQVPPDGDGSLLDYDDDTRGRWQYYSGAYFCVYSWVLQTVPLDENRVWGQGEDVQWSRLLYKEFEEAAFTMNPNSSVRLLKQKPRAPWELRGTL